MSILVLTNTIPTSLNLNFSVSETARDRTPTELELAIRDVMPRMHMRWARWRQKDCELKRCELYEKDEETQDSRKEGGRGHELESVLRLVRVCAVKLHRNTAAAAKERESAIQ